MNRGDDPDGLKDAFAAMRAERERSASHFAHTLAAGRARAGARHARARRRTLVAAFAAVPVVALLTLQLRTQLRERRDIALAEQAARIAQWHSPTDALLTPSYVSLMREIPSLDASVIDTSIQPEGASR